MIREDSNLKGHMVMFLAQFIFGVNTVIGKMVLESPLVTSKYLTFWRMFGAMVLMWLTSLFMPKEKVAKRDLFLLFVASMLGVVLNQSFFLQGLALTSPVNAALIISLSPIVTMIFAAIFLREPITWRKAMGVMMGVTGAALLIFTGSVAKSANDLMGDIFCLCSVMFFALYLTLFRDLIRRYSPVTLMKWMFLFAAGCLLPFSYESLSPALWMSMPTDIVLESLFVVVFATYVTYFLIPIGQQTLRPTVVSMYSNVQPLIASIAAVVMGLGGFGLPQTFAALFIVLGVYTTTTSRSRAQVESGK